MINLFLLKVPGIKGAWQKWGIEKLNRMTHARNQRGPPEWTKIFTRNYSNSDFLVKMDFLIIFNIRGPK